MLEKLAKYYWLIELGTVAVIAFLVGVYINSDAEGVYIKVDWGDKSEVTIGKTRSALDDLQLNELGSGEARKLSLKIAELDVKSPLARELAELKDRHKGPFKPIPYPVTVRIRPGGGVALADPSSTSCPTPRLAWACKGDEVFGSRLTLFAVTDPNGVKPEGAQDFDALQAMEIYKCTDDAKNTIWISEADARRWLKIDDDNHDVPEELRVQSLLSCLHL